METVNKYDMKNFNFRATEQSYTDYYEAIRQQ